MHNRKYVFFVVLSFLVVLFQYIRKNRQEYVPTKYEIELINYFKEIALQSEYDDYTQKVTKWKKPMLLYIVKEKDFNAQMTVIKRVIKNINKLATDGFKIILTDNYKKSNSILYLCTKEQVAKLDPNFYKLFTKGIDYDISGLAYAEFVTKTHIIDKALIFINSQESLDFQESTILEEITQSLGLAFDSKMYSNSIFYKEKSNQKIRTNKYSQLDRDIVRLLYHPKMKPGLDSTEVVTIIKKILKSES